jgi:hypothetical protein
VRIYSVDSRPLAVVLALPGQDKFYNWATGGWEAPFNAPAHVLPLAPMEAAPSPFSEVLSAEAGPEAYRADVATLVVTYSGSGSTLALGVVLDCLAGPPVNLPVRGTWTRG